MKDKDKILEQLGKMPYEQIDDLKCKKLLELKDALHDKYMHKDNLLIKKRDKEKALMEGGMKESQIERELRRDEELFTLRRLVSSSGHLVEKIKLEVEILKDYFWKNKQ